MARTLQARRSAAAALLAVVTCIVGCAGERRDAGPSTGPAQAHRLIERSLPHNVTERDGWTTDLYAAFTALGIEPTADTACATAAVIEQESGFRIDPVVPGLAAIAWKEIDARAARAGVPRVVVHGLLDLPSPTGRSYGERIDTAKTEKELSDIYEDFIGTVPMGRTLFADRNPIRTRGPMQVQVTFAEQFAASKPYPYPVTTRIAEEVFTRRGGLYFGIAHLLDYSAGYDRYLYRFADFNAGQYASRNAAFQSAITAASGIPLIPDGALLPHHGDANRLGATEAALRTLAARLGVSDGAVRSALERGKTRALETTATYVRVFDLAEQRQGNALPRAIVPRIELHGPKITRKLTTDWYANRVNERFERCLRREQSARR